MYRLRQQLARSLGATGAGAVVHRANRWNGVIALAYHRIGDGDGSPFDRGLWSATPDEFDTQLARLKRQYDLISPSDLADVVGKGRGRYALVTFDDGYRDNYETAFPILKHHQVPGVFFVSTGFVDRPRLPWWDEIAWMVRSSRQAGMSGGDWFPADVPFDEPDRERAIRSVLLAYKSMPGERTGPFLQYLADVTGTGRYRGGHAEDLWMTWDMLREMKAAGMCVGGHTVDHPVLARLTPAEQERQVAGAAARMEAEGLGPMRCFSYPIGKTSSFNDDTRACMRRQGVEAAFTYYGGVNRFDAWDWYDIRRVAVERHTTRHDFAALLALPQFFA